MNKPTPLKKSFVVPERGLHKGYIGWITYDLLSVNPNVERLYVHFVGRDYPNDVRMVPKKYLREATPLEVVMVECPGAMVS